jgi:hypothetical protein
MSNRVARFLSGNEDRQDYIQEPTEGKPRIDTNIPRVGCATIKFKLEHAVMLSYSEASSRRGGCFNGNLTEE